MNVLNNFFYKRSQACLAVIKKLEGFKSSQEPTSDTDYLVDVLGRDLYRIPPRPSDAEPYGWVMPINLDTPSIEEEAKRDFQRVLPIKFPEHQLNRTNYVTFTSPVIGTVTATGGFMEPHGHSYKPPSRAILFDNLGYNNLPRSDRNLGIDYVVHDHKIRNWYSAKILSVGVEGGYGNRMRVQFAPKFEWKGDYYPVYGAYGHAESFDTSLTAGMAIAQGQVIGVQGGTGGNYAPHVDFRLWIEVKGEVIDLSPNVFEEQLFQGLVPDYDGLKPVIGIKNTTSPFRKKVKLICDKLEIDSNHLMAVMSFESGGSFSPTQRNIAGSGAIGLIQFMPNTLQGMGCTVEQVKAMSAIEQLDLVYKYFLPYQNRLKTLEDVYMAVLWPAAIGKGSQYVLFEKNIAYRQNQGLDANRDGKITVLEATEKVRARFV